VRCLGRAQRSRAGERSRRLSRGEDLSPGKKQVSGWGIIELVAGLGWLAHTSTHSKPEAFFTGKLLNPETSRP
jgi:hypothetical protein